MQTRCVRGQVILESKFQRFRNTAMREKFNLESDYNVKNSFPGMMKLHSPM